jgi:hypothetical protein
MANGRVDWKAIHGEAPGFERRLTRALRRSVAKMRQRAPVDDLAAAIADRDVRRALAVISRIAAEDALAPAGAILRDAFDRGGRVGASQVPRRT